MTTLRPTPSDPDPNDARRARTVARTVVGAAVLRDIAIVAAALAYIIDQL